jgi:glutathione S-transferase
MPSYTVHYFDSKGRAEFLRLIFAAADVPFEDHRVKREDWPALKPTMPLGQVPVLELPDGKKLPQSKAIAMYLAREFKLAGASNWEEARAHMFIDTVEDLFSGLPPILFNSALNDEEKEKKIVECRDTKMKPMLDALEKCFKESIGSEGFLIGSSLTVADIAFLWLFDLLQDVRPPPMQLVRALDMAAWRAANYPTIEKHFQHVAAQPRLKAQLAKSAAH